MEQAKHNIELSDTELAFIASTVEFTLFLIKCWAHDDTDGAMNVIGNLIPTLAFGYAKEINKMKELRNRLFTEANTIAGVNMMGVRKKDGSIDVIPSKDQMN